MRNVETQRYLPPVINATIDVEVSSGRRAFVSISPFGLEFTGIITRALHFYISHSVQRIARRSMYVLNYITGNMRI